MQNSIIAHNGSTPKCWCYPVETGSKFKSFIQNEFSRVTFSIAKAQEIKIILKCQIDKGLIFSSNHIQQIFAM